MIDNSSVVLENGTKYDVMDKIVDDNDRAYVYLINPKDNTDICIRKEIKDEEDNLLVGLDSEDEFKRALELFINKNKEEFN